MEPDPDLRHLLDESVSSAPADELRAIVRRAGRRSARWAAAGAVVILAAGGLGGYLIAGPGGSTRSVVQTAAPQARVPSGAVGDAVAPTPTAAPTPVPQPTPAVVGGSLVRDFTRTTRGGVTLRVFQTSVPDPPAVQPKTVEVSTSGMIGTTLASMGSGTAAVATVLGTAEGSPVVVVTAWTSATVVEVRWSGEGGGDAMAPSGDFVALAVPVSAAPRATAALGTLTFTDPAGRQLQSEQVHFNSPITVCPPSPLQNPSHGLPATSSSSSGTSGTSGVVCAAVGSTGSTVTTSPPATGETLCPNSSTGTPAITSSLKVNCAIKPAVAPAPG